MPSQRAGFLLWRIYSQPTGLNFNNKEGANNSLFSFIMEEFLLWCNTPMYRDKGDLSFVKRVIAQQPDCDSFVVMNEKGEQVNPVGVFWTAEEVVKYYEETKKVKVVSELKPVVLKRTDTCYTYALKRTGLDTFENLQMNSYEFIEQNQIETVDYKDLKVGDILCRIFTDDMSKYKVYGQFSITKEGRLVSEARFHNTHFMVYEGDGLISHARYTTGEERIAYEISMKRLADSENDWFRIKLKHDEKG